MIQNDKLKKIYDFLRKREYQQSWDVFRGKFGGNANYANRKAVYDKLISLGAKPANIGESYEEFMSLLQKPNSAAQRFYAAAADRAKMAKHKSDVANLSADARWDRKHRTGAQGPYIMRNVEQVYNALKQTGYDVPNTFAEFDRTFRKGYNYEYRKSIYNHLRDRHWTVGDSYEDFAEMLHHRNWYKPSLGDTALQDAQTKWYTWRDNVAKQYVDGRIPTPDEIGYPTILRTKKMVLQELV